MIWAWGVQEEEAKEEEKKEQMRGLGESAKEEEHQPLRSGPRPEQGLPYVHTSIWVSLAYPGSLSSPTLPC